MKTDTEPSTNSGVSIEFARAALSCEEVAALPPDVLTAATGKGGGGSKGGGGKGGGGSRGSGGKGGASGGSGAKGGGRPSNAPSTTDKPSGGGRGNNPPGK